MPLWKPEQDWFGQDCYVIGGGPSLQDFDWDLLIGKNTIGCNSAFNLGSRICKVCIFGDVGFFRHHREELEEFEGLVVTNCPRLLKEDAPWLKVMKRLPRGMSTDALGWNANTGGMAVNLALMFGAQRVFLLGFDMALREGQANWHPNMLDKPNAKVYARFLEGFKYVARDLVRVFPGREIINVTDGSMLDLFPKVSLKEHFRDEQEDPAVDDSALPLP